MLWSLGLEVPPRAVVAPKASPERARMTPPAPLLSASYRDDKVRGVSPGAPSSGLAALA